MTISEQFQLNKPLSQLTTLGLGGPARYFIEIRSVSDMQEILIICKEKQLPYFILGKGSNSFFDDQGFHGVIIANRIDFKNQPEELVYHVGAGYSFALLGVQTARQGLSGLEFASGIPGSVGGAVYMNAGANGHETCDCLESVDFINSEGELMCIPASDLEFSYRYSSFQKKLGAIVGATFRLKPCSEARKNQLKIVDYRTKTQPYGSKSAGCIFRNPPNKSAGALIDQHGLKGTTVGGAQVSPLHANFLVNQQNASSQDMLNLIQTIKQEIKDKTGIELQTEVRYIPYNWTFDENHHD